MGRSLFVTILINLLNVVTSRYFSCLFSNLAMMDSMAPVLDLEHSINDRLLVTNGHLHSANPERSDHHTQKMGW